MTRGDSEVVRAAVTLNQSTPPNRVLHRTGAAEEPGLVVSCRVQAELTASKYQFELDETGWVQRSLYTADTARWSRYVTPKVGGTHTLTLKLRPIVKVQREDRTTKASVSAENSNVQEYETSAHVMVPLTERPQETMSRLHHVQSRGEPCYSADGSSGSRDCARCCAGHPPKEARRGVARHPSVWLALSGGLAPEHLERKHRRDEWVR